MEIKEFAFQAPVKEPDKKHVVLTCKDCGNMEVRPKTDPYSGHMFDQIVSYTCTMCRGNMKLITPDEETEDNE